MVNESAYPNPYNDPTLPGYRPRMENYNSGEPVESLNEADFLTFKDDEYRIQIRYPKDWSYSSDHIVRYMIVSFSPPPTISTLQSIISAVKDLDELSAERKLSKYLGNASVAIYVFPSFEKSLDKYVQDEINEMERDMPDFAISSSRLRRIGDRISAYEIIYTFVLSGERKKVMTIWTLKDGKTYQITYLAHTEIFSLYLHTTNMMIDSFAFT